MPYVRQEMAGSDRMRSMHEYEDCVTFVLLGRLNRSNSETSGSPLPRQACEHGANYQPTTTKTLYREEGTLTERSTQCSGG